MRVLLLCGTSSDMVHYSCSGVEGLKRDEFGVVVCCTGLPVPLFVSCPYYSCLLSTVCSAWHEIGSLLVFLDYG